MLKETLARRACRLQYWTLCIVMLFGLLVLGVRQGHCGTLGTVVAVPAPTSQSFFVMVDPSLVSVANRKKVKISFIKDSAVLWTQTVDVPALTTPSTFWVNYTTWGTGSLNVLVQTVNADSSLTDQGTIPLTIPLPQAWTSFEWPTIPLVPDPYTPVQVTGNTASVYGRQYSFGSSPFLDQVNSQGQDILASPVTLTGTVNGVPLTWAVQSWYMYSQADDKVVYKGAASSGSFTLVVTATLEFDGMLRLDYTLTPVGGSKTVRNLALVMPVKRSVAKSFMQSYLSPGDFWNTSTWNKSGDVTSAGWSCGFAPFFWLGDQTRGIQWFTESRLGWTPADTNKYLEVVTTTDAATLKCHLADNYRTISSPLSFTFGLMASPIRPRPYADDMSATRTVVFGPPEQLTNLSSERAGITIPASSAEFTSSGCLEMDFRVDWDPAAPTSLETDLPLLGMLNDLAYQIWVKWYSSGTTRYLRLMQMTPQAGLQEIARVPVSLVKGKWYRLALNYGASSSVYLDGAQVISGTLPGTLPYFSQWNAYLIAGGGRMTLARWRLSNAQRLASELQPGLAWTSDSKTTQMELLQDDPTPMNLTNPAVGSASCPSYLGGSWTYDPYNHWLTAGPDGPSITGAESYARMGSRGVVLFTWSTINNGQGDIANPTTFYQAAQLCNKYGITMSPYAPWGMDDLSSWFDDYLYESTFNLPSVTPAPGWTEGTINWYNGCPAGPRARMNLWAIDNFLRQGASGVYLDGQPYSNECGNPLHGHGVTDPATGLATSYARIFDNREYLKNMYRLVRSYKLDCTIDAHMSGAFTLPTMSFVTTVTNGESLGASGEWQNLIEPQRYRAEYNTRQYGFNGEALFYNNSPVPVEMGMAISGIHGQTPRCMWGMYPQRATKVWKLVDSFDTETANWMPYYYPTESAFHPESSAVLASAYVHPGRGALVLVTNWSDAPCSNKITVDWAMLGLPSTSPVKLVNTNMLLPVVSGAISPPLKQKQLTYLLIGSMATDPTSNYIYYDDFQGNDYSTRYTSDLPASWEYQDLGSGNFGLRPAASSWYTTFSTKDYKNGHFADTSYTAKLKVQCPNNLGPSVFLYPLTNGYRGIPSGQNPCYYGYEVGLYNLSGAVVLMVNRVNADGTVSVLYTNASTPYTDAKLNEWSTIAATVDVRATETYLKLEWQGVRQNGMPVTYSCEVHDTSAQRWTHGSGIGVRGYPGDSSGGLIIDNLAVVGNYTSLRTSKGAAENAPVSFDGAVVTRSFTDCFYVESLDRSYGVRVNATNNTTKVPGSIVSVVGKAITTIDGEHCIQADSAIKTGTSSTIIEPLAMTNSALGGGDWNYDALRGTGQKGVANGTGPSNIGLLVRTTGKVISKSGTYDFWISDGSGPSVKASMMTSASNVNIGAYVMVTGVVSCWKTSATDVSPYPLLKVRATSDVVQIKAP